MIQVYKEAFKARATSLKEHDHKRRIGGRFKRRRLPNRKYQEERDPNPNGPD
jgi:hypothetical protein